MEKVNYFKFNEKNKTKSKSINLNNFKKLTKKNEKQNTKKHPLV